MNAMLKIFQDDNRDSQNSEKSPDAAGLVRQPI
jgi:hypothetical protein